MTDDIFQLKITLAKTCTVQVIQRIMQGIDVIREDTISEETWDGVRYIKARVDTLEEDGRLPSLWVSCNAEEYLRLSELLRGKNIRGNAVSMEVNVNGNYVARVDL